MLLSRSLVATPATATAAAKNQTPPHAIVIGLGICIFFVKSLGIAGPWHIIMDLALGGSSGSENSRDGRMRMTMMMKESMQEKARTARPLKECRKEGREEQTVVADMEGAIIGDADPFAYMMSLAFEASGPLRFLLLLLTWPAYALLRQCGAEAAALRLALFVSVAGMKASAIESAAQAVLPKLFMDGLRPDTWAVFSGFGRRAVVSKMPRLAVEAFARKHLRADLVVGAELEVVGGRATGRLRVPGPLVGPAKRTAVKAAFSNGDAPHVAIAASANFHFSRSFLSLCKEPYVVEAENKKTAEKNHSSCSSSEEEVEEEVMLPEPVIFHDGRLVPLPTPLVSLLIVAWLPLGLILATIRIMAGVVLPMRVINLTTTLFGGKLVVRGTPPGAKSGDDHSGVLYVCNHRTLLDPVILSIVLKRKIPAVTYSVSRLSEALSPIPTVRLSRERHKDAQKIRELLRSGDVVVCPEGTTCRQAYLLRFSSLFAELSHKIVPVALECKTGLFYGTTAGGLKALDPIFFFMNPRPCYEVTFLPQLPQHLTCSAGRSRHDVANHVQRLISGTLGFGCTALTRKDKYLALAGNDGSVPDTAGGKHSFFSFPFQDMLAAALSRVRGSGDQRQQPQ